MLVLLVVVRAAACGAGEPPHEASTQPAATKALPASAGRWRGPPTPVILTERGAGFRPGADGYALGSMADQPPPAFDLVVLQQPNGELQEDIVERAPGGLGWLDTEISESFPASDPLSHWAGPPGHLDEDDQAHGLLVLRRTAADLPERALP